MCLAKGGDHICSEYELLILGKKRKTQVQIILPTTRDYKCDVVTDIDCGAEEESYHKVMTEL